MGDYLGMDDVGGALGQDQRYARVAEAFGAPLERLARGYEADPDLRADLLQEIHVALWRSFARFDGRCSERTWVYRVAHNVAATHMLRARRQRRRGLASLDQIALRADPAQPSPETTLGEREAMLRLNALIGGLAAPDRQVVLLYLEGLDAVAIGEVSGLTPRAVATKIHRLKAILARRFHQGGPDAG
jgi:RNA polymerase sigma-70 factor (ECF subfamily)